jgi:hypothetical protein
LGPFGCKTGYCKESNANRDVDRQSVRNCDTSAEGKRDKQAANGYAKPRPAIHENEQSATAESSAEDQADMKLARNREIMQRTGQDRPPLRQRSAAGYACRGVCADERCAPQHYRNDAALAAVTSMTHARASTRMKRKGQKP